MKNNNAACARWFQQATGNEPSPFQMRFADGDWLHNAVPVPGHRQEGVGGKGEGFLVDVRTGLGKTALAVLGRLWRSQGVTG